MTSSQEFYQALEAENAVRIPWILQELGSPKTILDIGCGSGGLSNALAKKGHEVFGTDLSVHNLRIAEKDDETNSVKYTLANPYSLPFSDQTFDAVCAMDILERVEEPHILIGEASRVLKPNGLFLFQTFNRNLSSYILSRRLEEGSLRDRHIYPFFLKPDELKAHCDHYRLKIKAIRGFRPLLNRAFFTMLLTRRVSKNFGFCFAKSPHTGYCGIATKRGMYGTGHS